MTPERRGELAEYVDTLIAAAVGVGMSREEIGRIGAMLLGRAIAVMRGAGVARSTIESAVCGALDLAERHDRALERAEHRARKVAN